MEKIYFAVIVLIIGMMSIFLYGNKKTEVLINDNIFENKMSAREAVLYFANNAETISYGGKITGSEVIINDKDKEYKIKLEDEFYLAVAPYISRTHPCDIHNLVSCQGELVSLELEVKVINSNGDIIIKDTYTTLENGFAELWLPRDETLTIFINYEGMTATETISTFSGDNTCLTTMKLE